MVLVLLALLIPVNVLGIWSGMKQSALIDKAIRGEITQAEGDANDNLVNSVAILQLVLRLVAYVAFCFWIYRRHQNLQLFRVQGLKSTPGAAVGWYFVPFMNWVRPYQITAEIWWVPVTRQSATRCAGAQRCIALTGSLVG